jgi:hypothetical protein
MNPTDNINACINTKFKKKSGNPQKRISITNSYNIARPNSIAIDRIDIEALQTKKQNMTARL